MSKYLKLFQNVSDYETYKNGEEFLLPNVSFIVNEETVHFNPDMSGYELFETIDGGFCVTEGDFYVKIMD